MSRIEENDIIKEKANGWLVALSILIPLAGLIIFITQKDKHPKTAKVSGICALISWIVMILAIFIILIGFTIIQTALDNGIFKNYENEKQNYYSNTTNISYEDVDSIYNSNEDKDEDSIYNSYDENNTENILLEAKDIVSINVTRAIVDYYQEKYISNEELKKLDYIVKGLKKSKSELEEKNVSLTAEKNKIYLKYDNYTLTGTVSDSGDITWSDIEEK